jgi:hypothetical protein
VLATGPATSAPNERSKLCMAVATCQESSTTRTRKPERVPASGCSSSFAAAIQFADRRQAHSPQRVWHYSICEAIRGGSPASRTSAENAARRMGWLEVASAWPRLIRPDQILVPGSQDRRWNWRERTRQATRVSAALRRSCFRRLEARCFNGAAVERSLWSAATPPQGGIDMLEQVTFFYRLPQVGDRPTSQSPPFQFGVRKGGHKYCGHLVPRGNETVLQIHSA